MASIFSPWTWSNPTGSAHWSQRPGAQGASVRLGFNYVRGLRQETAEAIVAARPFASINDLVLRVPGLRKDELRMLAEIGALIRSAVTTPSSRRAVGSRARAASGRTTI